MRTLARLATRGSGPDGKDTVDLILGVGMKDNTLKPDTIYEIREIMDDLVLIEIGPSAARSETHTPRNIWACGIEQVVTTYRDRWILTLKEWLSRIAQD